MARRITSAREQVEMLSRWRTAGQRADDFEWQRSLDTGDWMLMARTPDGNPVVVDTRPARGQQRTSGIRPLPQHGVNINDDHQDYTGQILRGEKTVETRNTNSLRPIIGHDVAIVRNTKRPNKNRPTGLLVGYATVGEPKVYTNADDFDADYHLHQVGSDSPHHISNSPTGVKYGYPLHNVEHEPEPFQVVGPGQPYRYRMEPRTAAMDWHGRDPHTVRVDNAEQIMTRARMTGRDFHVPQAKAADADALGIQPWELQRQHSAEAEKFVNGLLRDNGFDHENRGWVKVQPDTWNGRNMPATTQAWTDGSHIHLPGDHVNQLSLIHEAAHILTGTQEGEGHGPDFQHILHGLYHQHLGPEAADVFATATGLHNHTAAVEKSPEQHLRDTYEPYPPGSPNLPDSLKPHLMLPTDIAHHYREYDRPDDENTQMLKRVIADQGIRQPLKISTDGTHALMIEGNHRLNVARQLGISHVPVQVFMEKPGEVMTNESYSKPVPLEQHLGGWVDQNRQHLKSFWS